MRMMGRKLTTALIAGALASAACGGSGPAPERAGAGAPPPRVAPAGAAPTATIRVREINMRLRPAKVTLRRPGLVRLEVINAGSTLHALQVDGPRGPVRTRPLAPHGSATLTADLGRPGEYEWYCPIADHVDKGMRGTIKVLDRTAHD